MKTRVLFPLFLILSGCSPLKLVLPGSNSPDSEGNGLQAQISRDPITTSFADADKTRVFPDTFGNDKVFRPLEFMPKSNSGGYLLSPGFYEMNAQSYCLKAGTYGPSAGDGYLFAPLKGKRANVVQALVQRRAQHPQIAQRDVQALLWAIIAKAKFSNLSPQLKVVAAQLLTPEELIDLNGGALGLIPDAVLNGLLDALPEPLRVIVRAENKVRGMLYNGSASFSDLESQAMLAGMAPITNPDFKRGRWSKHKDGFYIRYFPSGYSQTRVQVYIPTPEAGSQSTPTPAIEFDATDDVAVPANTGAQRLMQSNQPVIGGGGACPEGLAGGARGAPAPIQEGSWDRSCRALAQCIARSFPGVTKIEGLQSRCSHRGKFSSQAQAFEKTQGQCAGHPSGADTGQPVRNEDSNGFSVFLTTLDAQQIPAPRDTPWEANSPQRIAGDRLREWLVGVPGNLGLLEVVWDGQVYSKQDNWKGRKTPENSVNYNRLRVRCLDRPTRQ